MRIVSTKYHKLVLDNFEKLFGEQQLEKKTPMVFFIEEKCTVPNVQENHLMSLKVSLENKYKLYENYKLKSQYIIGTRTPKLFPILQKIKNE